MNEKNRQKWTRKNVVHSARECAYLSVFVSLVIAVQLAFSLLPGVELVTVLFVTYSFVFGVRRGMLAATVFSLLRQFIFGIYPVVLILYLLYFNLLCAVFGVFGKWVKDSLRALPVLTITACVGTAFFCLMDNILTPIWYGYSEKAAKIYFYSSFSFMIPQIICTAVSVALLFMPLAAVFRLLKKKL